MFYIEEISLDKAAGLLSACGLTKPRGVSYTAGVFVQSGNSGGDRLAACGSLKEDMIQGVAVDPEFQGEDLTGKLMTHLIGKGRQQGYRSLYLFTKAEKAQQFMGLGFRLAAKARPYAALLEWGDAGVDAYRQKLTEIKESVQAETTEQDGRNEKLSAGEETAGETAGKSAGMEGAPEYLADRAGTGVLVMNCNPFTRGHRYLIEYAAARKEHVYVLAVEADVSLFSFADRLAMMKRGTEDLANVTVIPGGRYAVSDLTFPSYFTKEENLAQAHAAMDAELFAACIAPPLGADERFLGTEPVSAVTAVYNRVLKERLPKHGIRVTEIPRLAEGSAESREVEESSGQIISASRVREVLADLYEKEGTVCGLAGGRGVEKRQAESMLNHRDEPNPAAQAPLAQLKKLLPDSTMEYLQQEGVLSRLDSRFAEMMKKDREA